MKHLNLHTYAMVFALVCIWVIFTLVTDGTFVSGRNLFNLTRQTAVTAILAIGMVLIIVSANIDLSVGYGAGLLGAITAILHVRWEFPILLTLLIVILIGILIGVLQGYLVAYQRIPAFIVTLGGFLVFRGMMLAVTRGETIALPDNWLKAIGTAHLPREFGLAIMVVGLLTSAFVYINQLRNSLQSKTLKSYLPFISKIVLSWICIVAFIILMNSYKGIPVQACIMFGLAILIHSIANKTRFGRYVYAVGGNSDAAYLSGIDVRMVTLRVFAMMGALMAVAGIVMTARLGSAGSGAGQLLELEAIAACVIGGASLMGGRGTVFGAILGAFVMASLSNGMSLANMAPSWQDMIKGTVLVAAVGFDMLSRKQS